MRFVVGDLFGGRYYIGNRVVIGVIADISPDFTHFWRENEIGGKKVNKEGYTVQGAVWLRNGSTGGFYFSVQRSFLTV